MCHRLMLQRCKALNCTSKIVAALLGQALRKPCEFCNVPSQATVFGVACNGVEAEAADLWNRLVTRPWDWGPEAWEA